MNKIRLQLVCTIAVLVLAPSLQGQSLVLNLNLGSLDNGEMLSMDGLLGAAPDDPSNTSWNDLAISGINQTPFAFSGLIYSDNSPATGISLNFPGGSNSWNPQGSGLPLFASHFHPLYGLADGVESEEILEIAGLDDVKTYDLFLYTATPTGAIADFIVGGVESTLTSSNVNSFVENDNFLVFAGIRPDGGKITVTYQDHDTPNNGVINGLQLVQVPESPICVLSCLGILPWIIRRSVGRQSKIDP